MLSFLDRFLSIWIVLAMGFGIVLGYSLPNLSSFYAYFEYGGINLPLALGLMLMMYPPLAKVDYAKIPVLLKNKSLLLSSLALNWLLGPLLMFALGLIFLYAYPLYLQGLILIGLARCIAMVLVWNDLAKGDKDLMAALVAFNSLFQILCFAALAYLFLVYLPPFFGLDLKTDMSAITMSKVAANVLIYLGIPFVLGIFSRFLLTRLKGAIWYEQRFIPKIAPLSLIALLFTIIIMFSYKGGAILQLPFDVLLIATPLSLYFIIMFFVSWLFTRHFGYAKSCAICFSATGNNFELAIAISIASFGLNSPQSFAAVIGPLIEVPVLLMLVWWIKRRENGRFFKNNLKCE